MLWNLFLLVVYSMAAYLRLHHENEVRLGNKPLPIPKRIKLQTIDGNPYEQKLRDTNFWQWLVVFAMTFLVGFNYLVLEPAFRLGWTVSLIIIVFLIVVTIYYTLVMRELWLSAERAGTKNTNSI